MATLILNYNSRNNLATKTIEYILSLGVFTAQKTEKISELEMALEDVKKGRVYKAQDAKDLIAQCLIIMYRIEYTNAFKKGIQLDAKRGYDISLIENAIP